MKYPTDYFVECPIAYHLEYPDTPLIYLKEFHLPYKITIRNKDYRLLFVQHLMEYPIDYFIDCLVAYHLEYVVVDYVAEKNRLCNMPYVYLTYTS